MLPRVQQAAHGQGPVGAGEEGSSGRRPPSIRPPPGRRLGPRRASSRQSSCGAGARGGQAEAHGAQGGYRSPARTLTTADAAASAVCPSTFAGTSRPSRPHLLSPAGWPRHVSPPAGHRPLSKAPASAWPGPWSEHVPTHRPTAAGDWGPGLSPVGWEWGHRWPPPGDQSHISWDELLRHRMLGGDRWPGTILGGHARSQPGGPSLRGQSLEACED